MKLHIITPFMRTENFDILLKNLQQVDSWDIIITPEQHKEKEKIYGDIVSKINGRVFLAFNTPGDPAYDKTNCYIVDNNGFIADEDYYMVVCDDSALPEKFKELLEYTISSLAVEPEVIVVSAQRGDRVLLTGPQHGTSTLVAAPQNMFVGGVTYEQFIVKGSVLKKMHYQEFNGCADGEMGKWLEENYDVCYLPKLSMYFNFLQDGRWNKFKRE